jgi:hypothetical protein
MLDQQRLHRRQCSIVGLDVHGPWSLLTLLLEILYETIKFHQRAGMLTEPKLPITAPSGYFEMNTFAIDA